MSRRIVLGLALAVALPLAGCTSAAEKPPPPKRLTSADLKLVAFDSCAELTTALRDAAKESVGPYGFPHGYFAQRAGGGIVADGARTMADESAAGAAAPAPPAFSGTNVHEAGVDEPDIVKTDGRRIVTLGAGGLRVIDAAGKRQTGKLDLSWSNGADLLLSGDRVLVLSRGPFPTTSPRIPADGRPSDLPSRAITSTELTLIDIAAAPRIVSRFRTSSNLVDARQTGDTARIVISARARIDFPMQPEGRSDQERLAENRKQIDKAGADAWLPEWTTVTPSSGQDQLDKGTMPCDAVSRPAAFSGRTVLSVLTFPLSAAKLDPGSAVGVVADGDTVYGTPNSLYVASDDRWEFEGRADGPVRSHEPDTQIYRFDVRGSAAPVYRAGNSVPGYLVNQYALSEWDGHLRVATTDFDKEVSAVRVLRTDDLQQVGEVGGLGKNEKIYSVRFIGPQGYVVTFRQTDPLYSLDLRNPSEPRVTGELKITGYSSHLQPVGADRLVGIGQEADTQGRRQGTQVSLFDTSDPASPRRLSQHQVPGGNSEAEFDPHALLWWPATNLLVVPMSPSYAERGLTTAALALRVTDSGVTKIGDIQAAPTRAGNLSQVRRTLVVGDTLWTVSEGGLQASQLSTLEPVATVSF